MMRTHIFTFIFIFFLSSVAYTQNATQDLQTFSKPLFSEEFILRVLKYSNESKLIEIEKAIATEVKKFSHIKFSVPSLELKLYPFGYDDRRTDTFISRYGYNPSGTTNPLVFGGVQQFSINKAYYTSGVGLAFQTLTPFGGFFGFNISDFFLINNSGEEYRQRIKFDFVLSQPLFINNLIADVRPFSNEYQIINKRYEIAEFEKRQKENLLILAAYTQAYSLITLQKQKSLLEKTAQILEKDVAAMNTRVENGLVSKNVLTELELTYAQTKEQLEDLSVQYEAVRMRAARMASLAEADLVLEESEEGVAKIQQQAARPVKKDDLVKNFEVKKKELEYEIANKGLFSKDISSRPTMNLNFSLQPRYSESRANVGDFLTSFTDFSEEGSKIDYLFTVEFVFPLLTGFERRHRRSLDLLSIQAQRAFYEKELNDVWVSLLEMQSKRNNFAQKIKTINLDISLQKSFVATKKIQLRQGSTNLQELRRQELQLLEVQNRRWTMLKDKLINDLTILDSRGYSLKNLL